MQPNSRAKAVAIMLLSVVLEIATVGAGPNRNSNRKSLYPILALQDCPAPCIRGSGPENWTTYHEVDRLSWCNQTMLLDFAVYNPLDDPRTQSTIRSCSTGTAPAVVNGRAHSDSPSPGCGKATKVDAKMQLASFGTSADSFHPASVIAKQDIIAAFQQLQHYLSDDANCDTTIAFGYSGTAAVGAYVGSNIQNRGAAKTAIQQFIDHVQSQGISARTLLQLCGSQRNSDYVFGLVAESSSNLSSIQNAVRTWSDAKCVEGYEKSASLASYTWLTAPRPVPTSNVSSLPTEVARAGRFKVRSLLLNARADCRTVQVVSGDSCASLATKCGISGADYTKYNSASTHCSTLAVGQHVCCSSGTLPDLTPKPNTDGTCSSYTVQTNDGCSAIAASHGLPTKDVTETKKLLDSFNKNTWGWKGCDDLQLGIKMCLSTGDPPMPATVSNAVCGPQVPGTAKPANGKKLADLNPCPLNVCCNIWGQCGTTKDFCIQSKSATGAPGTSAPGTNGCVSNCGMGIVNNGSPPSSFINLAYFEAWNHNRDCLNMDVHEIDTKKYTNIHFAFADITADWKVDISKVQTQFDIFVKMTGVKRIISFGGWAFSTDQATYPIFRTGVNEANRQTFANNVISFVNEYNLDGVDFDWEYPAAPDIPGIPAGTLDEGKNYLSFLKLMRGGLPSGKSLSVAAAASYWYLKGFPIKDIGAIVDYIVYMTYDLHGQWDYGSKWSIDGCPSGNCLRSHINMTETLGSLSMITKAGVQAKKIVVGVSSYGRSFQMTTPGCTGVACTFVGPESGATPGLCTGQAGYISDAEIKDIIGRDGSGLQSRSSGVQKWVDPDSGANMMVYDDTQWVSYMDADNKANRTNYYRGLNFGGITDWAVDLQTFLPGSKCPATSPNCDKLMFISKGKNTDIDWTNTPCTNKWIADASLDPEQRWNGVGCDAAWKDALDYWKAGKDRNRGLTFSQSISNFFNGPEHFNCETTADKNGCDSFLQCHSTNHPAGYLILNSMIALNNIMWNFYDNVARAQLSISDTINSVSKTFSVIPNDSKALKIFLDILGLSFAMVAAPVWNIALKRVAYFESRGDPLGTLKDTVNGLVSNGITIAKDKLPTTPTDIGNNLKEILEAMTGAWYESIETIQDHVFDGSDESIQRLTHLMEHGEFLQNAYNGLSAAEIKIMMVKSLYTMLIPNAWVLSPKLGVVVVDAKAKCGTVDPLRGGDLSSADAAKSWVCHNDKMYYLIAAKGDTRTCWWDGHVNVCTDNAFTLPPGLTSLDGRAWGKLTKENFVHGAINTYEKNGNKNGAKPGTMDLGTDDITKLQNQDVTAAGTISIPVCNIDEARYNWNDYFYSGRFSANYPCN